MVACDTEASRRDRNRRDNIIYEYNRLVAAGCSRPLAAGWLDDGPPHCQNCPRIFEDRIRPDV
jgi:hypothetical protein